MISAGLPLLLAALAAQTPAADSLRALATRVAETALVTETRTRPLVAREAITGALDRNELTTAQSLAAAYALAWSDSFLVREVARFVAWPPDTRAVKVWNDSVRRAGITAYGASGPGTAIAIWRHALTRATSIGDSAGIGSLAGNIGAAFVEAGQPDSAAAYLTRAQAIARAVGDWRVEANTLVALAGLSDDRGDLAAARDGYTSALAIQQRIGDTRGMAAAYNNLGLLAEGVGDQGEARRQFEAALALNRTDGRDEIAATNLVNLAGLASLSGDFGRAERLYRDALATWRSREAWADAASALHGLGQLELRRGDYPAAQATLTDALAIYDRTGPTADAIAVRRDLAGALAAKGDLQGALDLLRRTQRIADSTRAPGAVRAKVALSRADYALQLNAFGDAEQLYGRAEFLARQSGDLEGVAEAQQGRGLLFLARENYPRAAALLATTLRTETAAGQLRAAALTRTSFGVVMRERGDTTAARSALIRSTSDLDRTGDPVAAAAAITEWAALEAPAVAESLYRAGLERLRDRVAPEVSWRLHEGLALALRSRGALEDAAREFRAALAETARPAGSLALAERRSAYLADKWEVYTNIALSERARGVPSAAFEASEQLRAREMLELLARGRIEDPADTSAELIEREQDLRRHIAELTQQVEAPESASAGVRGPEAAANGAALGALTRAQDAYAELLLEMRERAPRHVDLVARQTVGWRDVAQHLGDADAFIEYLVSDSGSLAFTVTRDTLAIVDLGIDRRGLARLVALARGALEGPHPRGEDLWRGPMRRLHQYLIEPIEQTGLLAHRSRLVLVPHAELHYLPFAALVDSAGRFLVQDYDLTETPSGSVWIALGDRPTTSHATGILALAPRPDALPATRREVTTLERLTGADVLTGRAASEAEFRRAAPTHRVLHLATYGVLNKQNPLFSFVELAPGGDQDGRLEVHEVFGLHLDADLVVLSACQTGLASGALADVPPGDDWVGLTRAFLHAGARRVVATLWPVDDWATAALMERFYQGYAGGAEPGRALAEAQRALLAQPATRHPFYWAGFEVVGGAAGKVWAR